MGSPAYSNSVFVWNIYFLIICVITTAAGEQNVNSFSKRLKNARDRTGFAQQHSSKSKISCAASCQDSLECQTFSFDKKTKECKLGNASSESTRMYRKPDNMMECPEQKGYSLWIYSGAIYCLKYYAINLVQPDAKHTCGDDGGHLALIDSDTKRLRLHRIFNELVIPTTQEGLWFDGYDIGDENKFMSWKGHELPESQWLIGEPHISVGHDCVGAKWNEFFLLRNGGCNLHTLQFFCEMELKIH